ncbi:MAG: alanine racemase [Burkholderiaceae bacterium]
MPRPIQAFISVSAIRHNLNVVRTHAPGARVWGVVKANAYGHGIARVLPAMSHADGLALLDLQEAQLSRQLGFVGPILLLEGCFEPADLELAIALHLSIVVHCNEQLQLLRRYSGPGGVEVYLKMNSGMNRLGFPPGQMQAAYAALREIPSVLGITLMTHFAQAETPDGITEALTRFQEATRSLPGPRSLANSAATLMHPAARADWVRPGIVLYGSSPFATKSAGELGLRPAMTLRSQIIAIQDLAPRDAVGYAGRFVAQKAMRIGVVACGYADGYPRSAPNGTPVLVAGHRVALVGAVSMDMITVDLSGIGEVTVGSPVELFGDGLSVDEVARSAGTVGYELLCALAARVPTRAEP